MSLSEAASVTNGKTLLSDTTYDVWDAEMVHGCVCDDGYTGMMCSLRTCITGDDPLTTGQVDEEQIMDCSATSGVFRLNFRDETSALIGYDATTTEVKAALEALTTIGQVSVEYSNGDAACVGAGNAITITFETQHGDIPDLAVFGSTLDVDIDLYTDGDSSVVSGVASVTGTKEDDVCNGRGQCSITTGDCVCDSGFSSSDGTGTNTEGSTGDCGYTTGIATCGGVTVCSSRGVCSGDPNYKCTCNDGFTGSSCSERTCPMGIAWWDEPTGTDTAHAMAECSNRGTCDRTTGLCTCAVGMTGNACQRLTCPGSTGGAACSGHGTCHSNRNLASLHRVEGVYVPFVYGDDPPAGATWDADKIYGCHCDHGRFEGNFYDFTGYDCSEMLCPTGDDPISEDQVNEVQTVRCIADGGSFKLSFRGEKTEAIPFDALAESSVSTIDDVTFTLTFQNMAITSSDDLSSDLVVGDILEVHNAENTDARNFTIASISGVNIGVEERIGFASGDDYFAYKVESNLKVILESINTIRTVAVSYENVADPSQDVTTACTDGSGVDIHIEFRTEFGDVPLMVVDDTDLTLVGNSPTLTIVEDTAGTKENTDCSMRGVCDATTGTCTCAEGYTSSNGYGNLGDRDDCGAPTVYSFST